MRVRQPVVVAVAMAVLATGCSGGDDEPSEADPSVEEADPEAGEAQPTDGAVNDGYGGQRPDDDELRTFAAGDDIPVQLTLSASDEGGRRTAIFGGYRGTVTLGGRAPQTCSIGSPEEGGSMEPGETYEVVLTCGDDVTLGPDDDRVLLEEGGRAIGSGLVRP